MEYLFIYLLQLAGVIAILKASILTVLILGSLLYFFAFLETDGFTCASDGLIKAGKVLQKISGVMSIILLLLLFVPTERTLLLMGGTYIGKQAINKVVTDSKVEKVNTIIELELDKYIDKLKEGDKNG